jgi:putative N6-adenine-specific DNA methylase
MVSLYAVCPPGLEPITARELDHLGLAVQYPPPLARSSSDDKDLGDGVGGVEFQGSLHDIYRTNLHVRTATRILVRLGTFFTTTFPELRRRASCLPWEKFLGRGQPVALRVTCHRSRLYHEGAVAERIRGAVADRLGLLPALQKMSEDEDKVQLFVVRLKENECTISVDSSGIPLHRRGYRLATAKAPLRETLAAGMLLASGWDGESPLIDPFCGSGTIPIEASLLAQNIPPGRNRSFAFMKWPEFHGEIWKSLLRDTQDLRISSSPIIMASDRDAGAIRAAQANAQRVGVAESINFACRSLSAIEPPSSPGWVVTNPPYGVRVSSNRDLRNLYAQIGKILRSRCSGWHVAMLCSNLHLLQNTGLAFDEIMPLMNGGLKVRLAKGRVSP